MKEGTEDKQVRSEGGHPSPLTPPVVSLPKGGGAIRGIGEKFSANPVTGTASLTVPIATTPGRSGFGPQLSLSYDSGAGNGPFGFGWHLSLPSITRKTDKGIPQYRDADESDVFILSGSEDLVPEFEKDDAGNWVLTDGRPTIYDKPRTVGDKTYNVRRYRPRVEGLFARIERWTNTADAWDVFWRSISRDNVTTWYGRDDNSRILDPDNRRRIFSWLICESYDDRGNAILYKYAAENGDNVDRGQANERNRSHGANRYVKRIWYGNRSPYLPTLAVGEPWPALPGSDGWLFEVVFDYGEHDPNAPLPQGAGIWPCRTDPFSIYRSGFEVRTYRLCRRILMFHHIPDQPDGKKGCDALVRSTNFTFSSDGMPTDARSPGYSFLVSVTQTGHRATADGRCISRSLPPLEFDYSRPIIQEAIEEVDPACLDNLPVGLDNTVYQWTDLHGEGIPGIVTEQAHAWFYKRNLSPIREGIAFGPLEQVDVKPAAELAEGARFMDLAGDGQPDLAVMDVEMAGLYEHNEAEGWEPFRPFTSRLTRDTRDPNVRLVDLDGDGRADVLVTEDAAFVWHPSEGEEGFGPAVRIDQAPDEEHGPRLVFADGTESIYLADLSGDGLTDLVRVRNGEVSYWPNLGYGRFGPKVAMDNAPLFDHDDQFDQKRIRLADIDGSGTTDIIYLHRDGIHLYFNQSGNAWSERHALRGLPAADDLESIVCTDLLGNGTACLVWSSPLPAERYAPMRYINLMGGSKPHLLVRSVNNMGAETHFQYAPSTKFYLQDRQNGTPWVTRLPFPVHCVEKVTVTDKWRGTTFSTSYSYHHGYHDGAEREFRGFGRIDQVDIEDYGTFAEGNATSPYITDRQELYQPPAKTVTWYHTGAFVDRERILSHLSHEYVPVPGFTEQALPEPELEGDAFTAGEWREAVRACKGMMLRQEVYELDVDALASGKELRVKLLTTAFHNCTIRKLQPMAANRHAVFHVHESEALTYHYELDLRPSMIEADPRITHTLNLKVDQYGNVEQSAAAAYPRNKQYSDTKLSADEIDLIHRVQNERHLMLTCNRYTKDTPTPDAYRLRMPCETQAWEITGINPAGRYFTLKELREKDLAGSGAQEIGYHVAADGSPQKRLIECNRSLYFADALGAPLRFGEHGTRGLLYENYTLAVTKELLQKVLTGMARCDAALASLEEMTATGFPISGYHSGDRLFPSDPVTTTPLNEQWWTASGIAGFAPDAAQHFFLPTRYTDGFRNTSTVAFDPYDLMIQSSIDPAGNTASVDAFDFRVLSARRIKDINNNYSELRFDALGMPTAMAIEGKGTEADSLDGFDDDAADPATDILSAFFTGTYSEDDARTFLGGATGRYLYCFGEDRGTNGSITWNAHPSCACAIVRETHAAQLPEGQTSNVQAAFEYSDGMGTLLVRKTQAEPPEDATAVRWIATGKTILNNKGKPVKQYEPYFSPTHSFEEPVEAGVTPVMYYDAAGRLVRTELPDGSFRRIEFSPWHVASFDANDTVLEPGNAWYAAMSGAGATAEQKQTAALCTAHAETPSVTILDTLGRDVIRISHNKYRDRNNNPVEEKYLSFTRLDAEGKNLWILDGRGNTAMRYTVPRTPAADPLTDFYPAYDIAGNVLFQHSIDAGERWMLNDAAGKPLYEWEENYCRDEDGNPIDEQRTYSTTYDCLRRTSQKWLTVNAGTPQLIEHRLYGEDIDDADAARSNNLRGQLWRQYDQGGMKTMVRYDFKGNVLEVQRRLAGSYQSSPIGWQEASSTAGLEAETFTRITEYDALNRMTRLFNWHKGPGARVAVYEPAYNRRGVLFREELVVRAIKKGTTDTLKGYEEDSASRRTTPLEAIIYNAKGQREMVKYGNGTVSRYRYDARTFRLEQVRTTRPGYDPPFPGNASPLNDSEVLQDLRYTYDPVGNVMEVCDQAYETAFFNNQMVEPRSRYVYDALYRLISADGREGVDAAGNTPGRYAPEPFSTAFPVGSKTLRNYTEYYSYDRAGNIDEMRHAANGGGWTRSYEYAPESNRLARTWLGSDEINAVRYSHDKRGNIENLANVESRYYTSWDYRDMVRTLNLEGGGRAYYGYDVDRQRTRKVVADKDGIVQWERLYLGGLDIYRRYSGGALMEEIESQNLVDGERRILLVEDVLQTDSSNLQAGVLYRYQYGDYLGSSLLELNDSAAIISYEEYHPYGTTAYRAINKDIRAAAKRYRYAGKECDIESGLYYHGSRYYVPWLGRWSSCDPAGLVDGLNPFVFVRDNPVSFVDPTGNQTQGPQSTLSPEMEEIIKSGLYPENVLNECLNARVTCEEYADYCRTKYRTDADIDAMIAKAKKEDFPKFSKDAQENMAHFLDATGSQKIMQSSLFAKNKKIKAALIERWRSVFAEGVKKRLLSGELKVDADTPATVQLQWTSWAENYSSDPSVPLAFSVGGFQLRATVEIKVTQKGPNKFHAEFVKWQNQAFDCYNWDPNKAAGVLANVLKSAKGLPSDKQMCCLELRNKGRAFLDRTEPWNETDPDVLKGFDLEVEIPIRQPEKEEKKPAKQ